MFFKGPVQLKYGLNATIVDRVNHITKEDDSSRESRVFTTAIFPPAGRGKNLQAISATQHNKWFRKKPDLPTY